MQSCCLYLVRFKETFLTLNFVDFPHNSLQNVRHSHEKEQFGQGPLGSVNQITFIASLKNILNHY